MKIRTQLLDYWRLLKDEPKRNTVHPNIARLKRKLKYAEETHVLS